jgi:hypothetical protein
MTKRKQQQTAPLQILQPVSVEATELNLSPAKEIEVPAGHVYIVALNEDGTEQQDSGFFYPERSYKRIYGNEARYSVKKKAH